LTNGSRRRSRSGSDLVGAPRLGAASKSGRSQCQRARHQRRRSHRRTASCSKRAHGCTCAWAHEVSLDVLRLVLRAICPPASAAEGGPCAGYSGFSLEPCSDRLNELGKPR
jgi:hypothetical protein